ncbi:phosphate ABC transporter ATP-binding protein (PhoT family) [Anaerobacterium chartisolvens]|uniref:Phosphate ABC transporter ATP-binding protein (PhoT family) n=1 Tax=Anaerobacterium chartisolvens TaxID=1297424 RepID=A0A369BEL5_9FIRM|nr:phosphate ABC transporter ATP-binding protein PstB [Anaerobacterium chartisolvens]RCX19993.1 phosphate ABC transporter ATP-binding protein (PhoT family) [Anaerobacterium chartisolvens]
MDDVMLKSGQRAKIKTDAAALFYGSFQALRNVTMDIAECAITAIIGPSGCGKSSLLRLFNRMNDPIPGVRVEGKIMLDGVSIYDKNMDVVALKKRVGMVFQKPNPFPMSVYDNMAFGPRHHGIKQRARLDEIVERNLNQVALWGEVKDKLKESAFVLSPGQQQRLCIARALAVEPEVLLMDESCSALDPESTMQVEGLMEELAQKYTIIIVTHSMEQAARVSHMTAFMMMEDDRAGTLVEYAPTEQIFSNPKDKRTEDYITGRFG